MSGDGWNEIGHEIETEKRVCAERMRGPALKLKDATRLREAGEEGKGRKGGQGCEASEFNVP